MVDRDLNLWWYRRQLGVKKKTKTSIPRIETFETIGQLSIAPWKATAMARDGDVGKKDIPKPFSLHHRRDIIVAFGWNRYFLCRTMHGYRRGH
ncbi:hypothetical protein TWF569_011985 [Orbilia oligospora]|uniref:Uncharacterized protein n=1 Tax=Orbilia oligospora TaxID=2813651 RepID=A0A7C8J3E2_ORBOL|nr:hypothetical protein TWF103_012000 [Orbilia oligospora]KAF3091508.1 hypothetical protein TWF102_012025 [Orbilia oligospora]KAF3094320.1 hypothetical protein TWF706_012015 [Orbilia oligospora]KAF3132880.1 hypothetical protein TWF594_011887 [Orbilia oligospora]KAF3154618.1 hypothetical protein TWF569_011985 [Orbilia oligospora]